MSILDLIAKREAEDGMRRSLEHAESEIENWGDIAYKFLKGYAREHARFCGWMVVKASASIGTFPTTEAPKAWGSVIQRAARMGIIQRDGTDKDPNRHGNLIPVWKSLIHGRLA